MTSAVNICNLALSHIGDEANLSSLTEQSVQAEHCNRFYPVVRRLLIERHTWSFSTRRTELAELSDDPPASWGFAYSLPAQCIKPFAVLLPSSTDDSQSEEYILESLANGTKVLYTNAEDATLRYAVDVTDTTKFTPMFDVALSHLLAAYIAGPIIKGREGMGVSQGQMEWFEKVALPQAVASDSNMRHTTLYDTFKPAGLAARA